MQIDHLCIGFVNRPLLPGLGFIPPLRFDPAEVYFVDVAGHVVTVKYGSIESADTAVSLSCTLDQVIQPLID